MESNDGMADELVINKTKKREKKKKNILIKIVYYTHY